MVRDLNGLVERIVEANVRDIEHVLRESTFKPGPPAYTSVIKACGKVGQWQKALEVYRLMSVVHGAKPNTITCSALINTLGRSKQCDMAFELFEESQREGIEPNIFTYSALLSACAKAKQYERAMSVFEDLVLNHSEIEVDRITYSAAISACVQGRNVDRAFQIFEDMTSRGIKGNTITYNALLNACEKCGDSHRAIETFNRMRLEKVPYDRASFHMLIGALDRARKISKVIDYYNMMRPYGINPDAATVSTVLNACANAKDGLQALKVYNEALPFHGVTTTPGMFNSLISALYRGRRYDLIYEKLKKNPSISGLSLSTYTQLITACERFGDWMKAFELVDGFKAHYQQSVDPHIWSQAFFACGRFEEDDPYLRNGMIPGYTSSTLQFARSKLSELWTEYKTRVRVSAYSAITWESSSIPSRQIEDQPVSTGASKPQLPTEIAMEISSVFKYAASAAARCSDPELASEILKECDTIGLPRDPSMYGALVSAWALSGDRFTANETLKEMVQLNLRPGVSTFAALALASSRAGDADTALSLAEDVASVVGPQRCDVNIVDAVVAACEAGGNWRRGTALLLLWTKNGVPGASEQLRRAMAAANGADPGPTNAVSRGHELTFQYQRHQDEMDHTEHLGYSSQYDSSVDDTDSDIWSSLEEGVSNLRIQAEAFTPRSSTERKQDEG